jgi:tetratricopeptide (TPR) repeat protein
MDEAARRLGASRDAYLEADDLRGEACSLLNIGRLQAERGDPALAKETLEAAVRHSRASGDMEMHAAALLNLGSALRALGEHGTAEERITTAYGQFTIADNARQRVWCLLQLAALASERGEPEAARVCLAHGRQIAVQSELPRELRHIDEHLAQLGAA